MIELLVVVAIVAMLMALLLPALQKAREAANRTACANNLKQIGIALHNYASVYGELPPGGVDDPPRVHGWVPFILPYLEQQTLFNRYDLATRWNDADNQFVVNTHLKMMQCPSADVDRVDEGKLGKVKWTAAAGDYGVLNGIHGKLRKDGLIEWVSNLEGAMWVTGPKEKHEDKSPRLVDIIDGTAYTLLVVEDAGRPERWNAGAPVSGHITGAGWADRANCFELDGYSYDGTQRWGPCAINCTNANEVYSFHSAGAHVLFADGSVHFLSSDLNIRVLAALITRAGGEVVSARDFE